MLAVLAVAVVLVVVIGGAFEVNGASGPYRRDVNRSYAAQGSILVDQSNRTGAALRALLRAAPGLRRTALVHSLDAVSSSADDTATSAASLAPPEPTVAGLPQVLSDRARAVDQVRSALTGLLGLGPGGRVVLTSDQAAARISGAGDLLATADRTYASVRRRFAVAPGNARLPRSRWVTGRRSWTSAPVDATVQAVSASRTLAPVHRVVLQPGTVHITPAAVPPVRPGGPSVVLPTRGLGVSAVVANRGNVGETAVEVSATADPSGPGRASTTDTRVSVRAGRSVAVSLPTLAVAPGVTYTLTVGVTPPPGQVDRSQTVETFSLRIAPPTPPTTTSTTTTTTLPIIQ